MENNIKKEQMTACAYIEAIIESCQRMQDKFQPGTSQHTLLVNRIRALSLAEKLMRTESLACTQEELIQALVPIRSIIHKSEKALMHGKAGSASAQRLHRIVHTMQLSEMLIKKKLREFDPAM